LEDVVEAVILSAAWWDWAMFIVIPCLLVVLVVAVWAISSALATLLRGQNRGSDPRRIPDVMSFLKPRSKPRRRSLTDTRNHILPE